jgi:hypothetical protein
MRMRKRDYINYLKGLISELEEKEHYGENCEFIMMPIDPYLYERLCDKLRNIERKIDNVNASCEARGNKTFEFFSAQGSTKESCKHIEDWLNHCEELTICDPYFFPEPYKEEYLESLKSILPENLKKINIYHSPDKTNATLKNDFKKYCNTKGIRFENVATNEIHDRVWIKNGSEAKVVGTSFNGLGKKKHAFILDLPAKDLVDFKNELFKIKPA